MKKITRFSQLPGWDDLTPEEKDRLRAIHAPRKTQGENQDEVYNLGGDQSISKGELERVERAEEGG